MAKYKAYPKYKDSGVEWLGEVPSHWEILSAKRMFQSVRTPAYKNDEQLAASQKYGVIPQSLMMQLNDSKVMLALKGTESFRHVEANNFVISLRSFEGGIEYSQYTGCVSPAYTVLKNSKPISYSYYRYLLKCSPFIAALQSSTDSLRDGKSINYEQFSALSLPLSSVQEQNVIAAFLDHETAKIDNLIEKQQQLIELLKEKRQAVISHAVTKGLNPDVPMKDSGVEWLGEIPRHWGVTRLKYECRNIVDCPHSTPNYTDEGEYPAIRTADILAGYLDLENCRRVTEPVYDERNFRLIPKAGDIIYSREGERFGIGAPIPEGAKVCLAQRVMLFRAKSTPGYLMWALNSSSTYTQAQQDCIGSTSPHVNVDTIKNFILAWPPENEREEISNFIHQTLDSVESLTVHLTEKLTLLQERRTALISAAVTGKIDVRDWVAPDTQDVEEPQEATA
ncbi:restriction endonuclease subunit S [Enterobacter adelaidei]